MRSFLRRRGRSATWLALLVMVVSFGLTACAGGNSLFASFGTPFTFVGRSTGDGATDGDDDDDSTLFDEGGRRATDPCSEATNRKFVRISMRSLNPDDYTHYFLVLIAYVNGDLYPEGAVCPDDISLYTSFGYIEIPDGVFREFGNLCVVGPALLYFHESGQFQRAGGIGGFGLASAIAPAQGTSPTYDTFFNSGAAQVPVPDWIVFHNPGTGDGASLKISLNDVAPCDLITTAGDPACNQDAFYYVDEFDLLTGSTALGLGSGRRVPSEIQGTACECLGFDLPLQMLAPSGVSASSVICNEFLRGGRIEYVFTREDTTPAFPQLLWRVTDEAGAVAHDFDSRAGLP